MFPFQIRCVLLCSKGVYHWPARTPLAFSISDATGDQSGLIALLWLPALWDQGPLLELIFIYSPGP